MIKEDLGAPVIFVSGILEKKEGNVKKIFLQTRWKPETSPVYSGLLEIPGGRISGHENVFDALQREVEEECGLKIVACRDPLGWKPLRVNEREQTIIFKPFVCQQVITENSEKLWFGFVFVCEVEGNPKMQKGETKDPKWVSHEELRKLLDEQPEKIFPHQYQALKYYLENIEQL